MKIRQECGQKWYRFRSWRIKPRFRKIKSYGFAIGPIMFFKKGTPE